MDTDKVTRFLNDIKNRISFAELKSIYEVYALVHGGSEVRPRTKLYVYLRSNYKNEGVSTLDDKIKIVQIANSYGFKVTEDMYNTPDNVIHQRLIVT